MKTWMKVGAAAIAAVFLAFFLRGGASERNSDAHSPSTNPLSPLAISTPATLPGARAPQSNAPTGGAVAVSSPSAFVAAPNPPTNCGPKGCDSERGTDRAAVRSAAARRFVPEGAPALPSAMGTVQLASGIRAGLALEHPRALSGELWREEGLVFFESSGNVASSFPVVWSPQERRFGLLPGTFRVAGNEQLLATAMEEPGVRLVAKVPGRAAAYFAFEKLDEGRLVTLLERWETFAASAVTVEVLYEALSPQ